MVEIVDGETGEVISMETVEYAYTREGRREIGKEYPSPIPMEPPIGYVPAKPIHEQIREMVMRELSAQAADQDMETMEEADDFDVGDDYDPSTPYEEVFEPTDPWPASRAVQVLEQRISERRNAGRIDSLKAELAALENGQPWPPASSSVMDSGGGGGAKPPSGEPSDGAS